MIHIEAVLLIKMFEGLHDGDLHKIGLQPKMCPAGIWTVGYGHALFVDGKPLKGSSDKAKAYKMYPGLTEDGAYLMLIDDLKTFESLVRKMVRVELNEKQIGALVSFSYNLGSVALKNSTLLQCVNNHNFKAAADEFAKWNKATVDGIKVIMKGLTNRRAAEAKLFLSE